MSTAQLNVRIDENLKEAGDRVLERFGVSAVQIIRSTWQYMADHQKIPAFVQSAAPATPDEAADNAQMGAGMALRLAQEAGIRAEFESMTYAELRESAFEEMLLEQEERHA